MSRRGTGRPHAGFTLIELLVTIAILAMVATALMSITLSSTRQGSQTARRADVQGGARQAMSILATEIRQAGLDPRIPPIGVVGVVSADSISVHIRSDLDGNGVIQTTEPSEDVTYTYDPGVRVLRRDPGTGAVTILANVTACQFAYFDGSNAPVVPQPLSAADAARVHSIGVTLTASESDSNPVTLSTRITLRNR